MISDGIGLNFELTYFEEVPKQASLNDRVMSQEVLQLCKNKNNQNKNTQMSPNNKKNLLKTKAAQIFQKYDAHKRGSIERSLCINALEGIFKNNINERTRVEIDSSLSNKTSLEEFLGIVSVCKKKIQEKPAEVCIDLLVDQFSLSEIRHFIICWEKRDVDCSGFLPIQQTLEAIQEVFRKYRTKQGMKIDSIDMREIIAKKRNMLEGTFSFQEYLLFIGEKIMKSRLRFRKSFLSCFSCLPL